MEIEARGCGGPGGWPEPGCRCASCLRAADGPPRQPFRVLVDGALELTGPGWDGSGQAGYDVRPLAGGWDVTAPDGTRLLAAAGPGARPRVPPGTARYDAVLLDLVGDPAQLGLLRGTGAVTGSTLVLAMFGDHRIRSGRELARRCRIWGAVLPRDGDTFTVPGPARAGERRRPWRVLILGGARSGKSAEAELRVAAEPSVTYVATGRMDAADADWAARIAAHRARRPAWWHTAETTDLAGVLQKARGAVLVDSVTAWLAAMMDECRVWDGAAAAAGQLAERTAGLVAAWRQADAYVVAVSDETGLGIVPETRAGRLFRDELGLLNQQLAAESEDFTMVIAGRARSAPD
ncbi:MAG TPA: bifunctional adenosylcobinamide kinase/adenosylcobinamide-phosphate guanylyltransferase [Streptosporangiaceae bacterium]